MKRIVVGQSGGPTCVINSSLAGVFKTAKDRGVETVFGMRNGIQGFLEERLVDMGQYVKSPLDIELLRRTPSSYLGSCRFKLPEIEGNEAMYDKIFAILKKNDIDAFFYIGGNDSMDTIAKLSKYGKKLGSDIRFMGVPKTVDNDLAITDHTPGFGSAAKFIAAMTKELIRDSLVYDIEQVTVVEIMGRNAGWLTAAAALAAGDDNEGPDLIYLPELDFDPDAFIEKVRELQKGGRKSVVACVSEGIHTAEGKYIFELGDHTEFVDSFGHKQLSGTGARLAAMVAARLGCKTRGVEFSSLQRCAAHIASGVDMNEAFCVGGAAFKAADDGETGKVVLIERVSDDPYLSAMGLHDVNDIANVEKKIPMEWITKDGTYVGQEFVNYALPLIQGEFSPIMVDGKPSHLVLPRG